MQTKLATPKEQWAAPKWRTGVGKGLRLADTTSEWGTGPRGKGHFLHVLSISRPIGPSLIPQPPTPTQPAPYLGSQP